MGNMFPNMHAYLLNVSHNYHNHPLHWCLQSCGSGVICLNSRLFPGISHPRPFPNNANFHTITIKHFPPSESSIDKNFAFRSSSCISLNTRIQLRIPIEIIFSSFRWGKLSPGFIVLLHENLKSHVSFGQ
jgi:hypothetical protein